MLPGPVWKQSAGRVDAGHWSRAGSRSHRCADRNDRRSRRLTVVCAAHVWQAGSLARLSGAPRLSQSGHKLELVWRPALCLTTPDCHVRGGESTLSSPISDAVHDINSEEICACDRDRDVVSRGRSVLAKKLRPNSQDIPCIYTWRLSTHRLCPLDPAERLDAVANCPVRFHPSDVWTMSPNVGRAVGPVRVSTGSSYGVVTSSTVQAERWGPDAYFPVRHLDVDREACPARSALIYIAQAPHHGPHPAPLTLARHDTDTNRHDDTLRRSLLLIVT